MFSRQRTGSLARARMLPQRKEGSRQAARLLGGGFGERLSCLAPLLNIAFPLTLGSANDIEIPLVELLFSFLASDSVSFLDFADQLIGLTVDHVEVVIRQFSPTPLDRSFHLFPFALELV